MTHTPPPAPDQSPLDLASAAPPEAPIIGFRAIYEEWYDDVLCWIRVLGVPDAGCDDIARDVFLAVRSQLHAIDVANFAGYLYGATQQAVRDFHRRAGLDEDAPTAALASRDCESILCSILRTIPEERRVAFLLFEIEGFPEEEIARIQGVSTRTVARRLRVARQEIRRARGFERIREPRLGITRT